MKIEDAIGLFESSFFEPIEHNPVGEPLRADVDIVECVTGGIKKEGGISVAWATSEADAVRLWFGAANTYHMDQRVKAFEEQMSQRPGPRQWLGNPKCTLVWRVKPEAMSVDFKYLCEGYNVPNSPDYDPYVKITMWNVRARFGVKVEWTATKSHGPDPKPGTPDDEAVVRAIGALASGR